MAEEDVGYAVVGIEDWQLCPEMRRLRETLDEMGIEYVDGSEEVYDPDGDLSSHMERTKFERGGGEVSVVWGYMMRMGRKVGVTRGWPVYVESWDGGKGGPAASTVEEIVEGA